MREAKLFYVPDGLDFGITWPLVQTGKWAPPGYIREWLLSLFDTWPVELVMVALDSNNFVLSNLGP